jgi:hypothetical protein
MSALEPLRKRAGLLGAGLGSFLVILAVMRWWSGEPIFQPSGDLGIVIGVAMIALYFVLSDARASKAGPRQGRAPELN